MTNRKIQLALHLSASVAMFGLLQNVKAQTVTGNLSTSGVHYGSTPLAVQTIETGFGNSTVGDGTSSGGSELDAAYGQVSNGTLFLFFAGNIEGNSTANHLDVFIADSQPNGQNTLAAATGNIASDNGLVFPSGFNATYVVDVNDYQNTLYVDQDNLSKGTGGYLGSVGLSGGIGSNQNLNGLAIGFNNTNAAGVGGNTGAAANQSAAAAVTTGFEVGIPLSSLNVSGGSVQVLAAVNGGGDGYLSNQFLPGLPNGYGNLGNPKVVNLQTDGANITPFTVTIPAVPGQWLPAASGSWNTATNWSNSAIPNAPGAVASFSSATSPATVTLDGNQTVGSITFNSTSAYTISSGSGGTLTLNNNGSNATITNFGGNHVISAPLALTSSLSVIVQTFGDSVTISGNMNGSGGLIATGPGGSIPSLILSGSNTYRGGTDIEAGNLTLGSATALPVNTALTLSAKDVPGGVLDLNGNSASLSSITVTTGPLTNSTHATAEIINTNSSAGTVTLTYAGSPANPSTLNGMLKDSNSSGGSTTALLVTSGSLTLSGANTYAGSTNVAGGSLTLAGTSSLPGATALMIGPTGQVALQGSSVYNALTLANAGKLDVGSAGLNITNASIGTISTELHAGYAGGTWNGSSGIVSSAAAADTTHLTALGSMQNGTGVSIAYTYYGDALLAGTVNSADYAQIDAGFLSQGSANALTGWQNGDFNYDGFINGSDYTLIDNAFNQQGAVLLSQVASTTAQIAGGASAVPEPSSLSLIGLGAAALLGRRRRHN
jgi:autotransporter-associated beta strand protein